MKVLLDSCVWAKAEEVIRKAGHDVILVSEWEKDPGDDEIIDHAHREGQILVTLDKDFGELAVVFGRPHNGIVRLVGIGAREQGEVCVDVLDKYSDDLLRGAILTVQHGFVRIRLAEE